MTMMMMIMVIVMIIIILLCDNNKEHEDDDDDEDDEDDDDDVNVDDNNNDHYDHRLILQSVVKSPDRVTEYVLDLMSGFAKRARKEVSELVLQQNVMEIFFSHLLGLFKISYQFLRRRLLVLKREDVANLVVRKPQHGQILW